MEYRLIQPSNINRALEKAKQYRALLEPELAISICLDIFAVAENHQASLIIYILALTDTLSDNNSKTENPDKKILEVIAKLDLEYQRKYYTGIFYERKARSLMQRLMSKSFAYNVFLQAMGYYKDAEKISTEDDDDAILRYNSCLRTIENEHLEPRQDLDDANWQSES